MASKTHLVANTYRDSVALMQHAEVLRAIPGVEEAAMVMATVGNLALLREVGLATGALDASPNDLAIVVRAKSAAAVEAAMARALELLAAVPVASSGTANELIPRALAMLPQCGAPAPNLALISVPGEYAAAEALKALHQGRHVMLFSDNVTIADEVALKRFAAERRLLVMGPDCGTAIIDGAPLAFANIVRRGPIGCVAASGTGLQEVTTLVDRLGSGISQAIGTGGRDLSASVGGATMLAGLALLAADPDTEVIVLISKPPAAEVAARVLAAAAKVRKPVVVNFVGGDPFAGGAAKAKRGRIHAVTTLEAAARAAVALAAGRAPPVRPALLRPGVLPRIGSAQRYVRGLFSGGTFCYEAGYLLGGLPGSLRSNAPVRPEDAIDDPWRSTGHTLIDLGDDIFTRGRPHPMIDHQLRNERLVREAGDPEVAVILFDLVLGLGSHADPAAAMAPALRAARAKATKAGRRIALVASVCGTDADPQNRSRQEAALHQAGVLLAPSNAQAARIAAASVANKRATK